MDTSDEPQQRRFRDLLTHVSHELRTPLHSMLLLARMLADNDEGNLSAQQVEFAQTIHAAGVDLLALVNDMLDLAKIESGTLALEVVEVDVDAIAEHVERSFRPVAERRGLALSLERGHDVPATLRTDRRRLQQVLKNLLGNAMKFTDRGRVALKIDRLAGRMVFRVTDTGIGIPSAAQALIFDAFQQADVEPTRRREGTGIGLSISREIARLLGGDLEVESEPGHGSTFSLYLPCDGGRPVVDIS